MSRPATCAVVLILLLAATLVGAGVSSAQEQSSVRVDMTEFVLALDNTSAPAGPVAFSATNAGAVAHNLIIIRTELAPGSLPVTGSRVDVSAAGLVVAGEIDPIDAGATVEGSFDLSAGSYVLICNVAGHYQQGMYVGLNVLPNAPTPQSTSSTPAAATATPGARSLPPTGTGSPRHQSMESTFTAVAALVAAMALTMLSARQLWIVKR